MEPAEYEYMFRLEDTYWWYVGMRRIADRLVRRDLIDGKRALRVLDAGAGTGGSLRLLERYGEVTAFDFEPAAARMFATREKGRICVASIDSMPFAGGSFDLITSFDVLCQLSAEQERPAIAELLRVLKPGGGLLLRVPAFQFLYGRHDIAVHSTHRYSAGEITCKLEDAGFRDVKTTYANTLLFPVAVARRLLTARGGDSDVRPLPVPLNAALKAILSAEAPVISRVRLPFGLSVFATARKP